MTIGIAATGPWAGAAILAGLRAVEAVGRGAIGGFVSLAVLTLDQQLLRAETQTDGTRGLFDGSPPDEILQAQYAALISSGPNRPAPLSQFIAAAPGVGIVTGHRFPQVSNEEGHALNALILEEMQRGAPAQEAIDALIHKHPHYDAGFIAISTRGDRGLGNMPSVQRLLDQGTGTRDCPDTGASVTTLHNAILPSKAIATVAIEVALDEVRQRVSKVRTITIRAGLELHYGIHPEIHIDGKFNVTRVVHPDSKNLQAKDGFGIGDKVKVLQLGTQIGWLGQEPFMVVKDCTIITLDGKSAIQLPVLIEGGSDI